MWWTRIIHGIGGPLRRIVGAREAGRRMGAPLWSPVRYPTRVSLFEMYCPLWSPVRYPTCVSLFEMYCPLSSPHPTCPVTAWLKRLYPPPKPLPQTPAFWLATTLVTLLAILFSGYFISYLTGRQDAYLTNAEDLGIMDQAIWNTLHGHLLHQSICNIVSDTNCYSLQGITRFAIHFEPILLTSALLLFTLYFIYTRRTAWLFVFAILAMACKEEIPLVVACLGLWSMLLQRRWRSGLLLLLLALTWTSLALLVIHLSSPTGQPLLAARYAYLGNSPPQIAQTFLAHPASILKQHLLDRAHRTYLASLLAPASYLPLLAPWILILALPTLALNLLSSNPGMYSGLFQYNAEIVPILIFATIETMALILWLVQNLSNAAFLQTWPV